ncbi:MAG: sugar kinase [Candidatus Omnitrophica bacterium]|nr:sugar kinase [Candidatus Omnitrophota bacterium]
MRLLIVGSIAIDSIQTPWGEANQILGGSATYAALAARLWSPVDLVGVVGSDFPPRFLKLFDKYRMNGQGIQKLKGRTFRWKGRYNADLQPKTLFLDLGVFSGFQPKLTPRLKKAKVAFLGNIHPTLQWQVLKQLSAPRITACDSRDDWILTQRRGFLKLLKRVDIVFLNDSEARLLTGIHGLVQATRVLARLGPKVAVVKKGEHGVLAASREAFFSLPSFPVSRVVDPTGAGDAFAGACLGYLNTQRKVTWAALCQGIQYASAAASMTIEAFGPARLLKATRGDVLRRARSFRNLARSAVL